MIIDDQKIKTLVNEKKDIPKDIFKTIGDLNNFKQKRGHREINFEIKGVNNNQFRLIIRISIHNSLDFSCILTYTLPDINSEFILLRYNGKSHEHENSLEHEIFYNFHIHYATQRYQEHGFSEEEYAIVTDRYSHYIDAFQCLIKDCNCQTPGINQRRII